MECSLRMAGTIGDAKQLFDDVMTPSRDSCSGELGKVRIIAPTIDRVEQSNCGYLCPVIHVWGETFITMRDIAIRITMYLVRTYHACIHDFTRRFNRFQKFTSQRNTS